MSAAKKQPESKALTQQKHQGRRRWVTFIRMCRYGINNFTRNAWLTVAATAVMTITLLIIFVSVVAHNVLVDTVDKLRDSVHMSIYLKYDTSQEDAEVVADSLRQLSSVVDVNYISPDEARERFVQQNKDSVDMLEAIKEAENRFPGTLSIKVQDINDTSQLAEFVETNEFLSEHIDPARKPSFAGDRKSSIETIGRAAEFAQRVGIGASLIFVVIATLIIFNTIRMAIFNRKEEIYMMKLIGAEPSFIRGPFVVEAVVYGFFGTVLASVLGYILLYVTAPTLISYQINAQPTIDTATYYAGLVVLAMFAIGAFIGVISSLLATRRYLKP